MTVGPPDPLTPSVDRFNDLAAQWKRDTVMESMVTRKATHWAYLQIIGMGPAALPFILKSLEAELDHWFVALTAIVGTDVAQGHDTMEGARQAWLTWGRKPNLPLIKEVTSYEGN